MAGLIVEDYGTSLTLNPSLKNPSWSGYMRFLLTYSPYIDDAQAKQDEVLAQLERMDADSPLYFNLAAEAALKGSNKESRQSEVLNRLDLAISRQPRQRKKLLQLIQLRLWKQFERYPELAAALSDYDADSQWTQDSSYIELRAQVYAQVDGRILDAVRCLEGFNRCFNESDTLHLLLTYLIFCKKIDRAQKLFDENRNILDIGEQEQILEQIHTANHRYDSVLALCRSRKGRSTNKHRGIVFETHTLLKLGHYEEAERTARAVLEPAHFSVRLAHLIVNHEIASYHYHHKVDKPRLSRIAPRIAESPNVDDSVRMCAFLLLNDKARATDYLKKMVKEDKTEVFQIEDWAIWDIPGNRAWRGEVLKSQGLTETIGPSEIRRSG